MSEFQVPKREKKVKEPKLVIGPAPAYEEYKPDLAMRQAIARAQRDQKPLISLTSSVPSYVISEK